MSGWDVVCAEDGDLHVVPKGDRKGHWMMEACHCKPTLDPGCGWPLWVHHSRDRREHTVERQ